MKIFRYLLFPFAILYWIVTEIRNLLYSAGILNSTGFKNPTISVGNLSTGGTGKSPHVLYLAELLSASGSVATLSRGYGRKTKGFREVKSTDAPSLTGDEPLMFKSVLGGKVHVFVDEDRINGITRIVNENPSAIAIILDDAFQHRKVIPGLNILVTPFHDPYFRDFILPAGNLRESRAGAKRADIIVISKCPAEPDEKRKEYFLRKLDPEPHQQVFFSSLIYGDPVHLYDKTRITLEGKSCMVFTGIADPSPLEKYLKEKIKVLGMKKFPDHHEYSTADLQEIRNTFDNIAGSGKIILTTEKDAVRLQSEAAREVLKNLPVYFIPVRVTFGKEQEKFNSLIHSYVKGNHSPD